MLLHFCDALVACHKRPVRLVDELVDPTGRYHQYHLCGRIVACQASPKNAIFQEALSSHRFDIGHLTFVHWCFAMLQKL